MPMGMAAPMPSAAYKNSLAQASLRQTPATPGFDAAANFMQHQNASGGGGDGEGMSMFSFAAFVLAFVEAISTVVAGVPLISALTAPGAVAPGGAISAGSGMAAAA